jgi:murein DD-endopeptidase MepM/ murein hydrolase activator NlpD
MTALVADADMNEADRIHAVPPCETVNTEDDILDALCLRLWRSNRRGEPDTAADVGADAGTPVYAPVSGTVVSAAPYLLYGKYDDVRIAIRPDGRDDIDVVLIHIESPLVRDGDRVEAGVTRIASVRRMADKMDLQLGQYAANGGDHVHLQINRAETEGASDGS